MNAERIRIRFLILFLLLSFSLIFAAEEDRDESKIVVNLTFSEPIIKHESPYDLVYIDDLPLANKEGEPLLPVKNLSILIPDGMDVAKIEAKGSNSVDIFGQIYIKPGQMPISFSEGAKIKPLSPKSDVYDSEDLYPENIVVGQMESYKHAFRILSISITPIRYNPYYRELKTFKDIQLVVSFKKQSKKVYKGAVGEIRLKKKIRDEAVLKSFVINPEDTATYSEEPVDLSSSGELSSLGESGGTQKLSGGTVYKYVVITSSDLASTRLTQLVDQKNAKGISATLVTTDWIYSNYSGYRPDGGTDNQTRIRNFIIDAYNTWGTEYVLLAGDKNRIPVRLMRDNGTGDASPTFSGEDIPADMYYGCLSNSFDTNADGIYGYHSFEFETYHEVYVGRAPIENTAEANYFSDKTLEYINHDMAQYSDDYTKLVGMVGEFLWYDQYGDPVYGSDFIETIRTSKFESNEHGSFFTTHNTESEFGGNYDFPPFYEATQPWSLNDLIPFMNNGQGPYDGVHILNHMGHGASNECLNMFTNNLSQLNNSRYFFVYSQACNSGAFDYSDCFAEEIVAGIEYGAFAVIMNSRAGWGSDNIYSGPSNNFNKAFWDQILFYGNFELGRAHALGKETLKYNMGFPYYRWCYKALNLFGDPEVQLKTKYFLDSDNDGLTDYEEDTIYGTDKNDYDTDNDGLSDGYEVNLYGDDWDSDPDGDLFINILDPDSDNDGWNDGEENSQGSNPLAIDNYMVLSNQTLFGNEQYFANIQINAGPSLIIDSSADIMIDAGDEVRLLPGFETEYGAELWVKTH